MQELLPEYPINMVCVDIPITELQATRKNNIQPLLYPLNTVLDDSIGKTLTISYLWISITFSFMNILHNTYLHLPEGTSLRTQYLGELS